MVGSGTTAVVARRLGHHAVGYDTDPLAVLIATAWCSDVPEHRVREAAKRIHRNASRDYREIPLGEAYPPYADDETRSFTRYWFDETNRRQLAALAHEIHSRRDPHIRNLLWCAFSRLIITKQASASRALDLAHSRPHRVDDRQPIRPLEHFLRAVDYVINASPFKGLKNRPRARIRVGDARALPAKGESFDFVITSPPYLNGIDYLRGHKFSLIWMGHPLEHLRETRASNIGTEVAASAAEPSALLSKAAARMGDIEDLPAHTQGQLTRFVKDMHSVLREIMRVLKPDGRAVLVVGDSSKRGVFVRNSRAITYLAKVNGLDLVRRQQREIPETRRYLPPPSARGSGRALRKRLRTEVVLTFAKSS
jgi:DNA modification methylase